MFLANKQEIAKRKKYEDLFDIPPGGFIPIAFESHGAWGPNAMRLFKTEYETIRNDPTKVKPKYLWHQITSKISLAICRTNYEYCKNMRFGKKTQTNNPVGSSV